MDTKATLVSNIESNTREAFTYLHSKTFYSLYPNLFDIPDGMVFTHDHFSKHSSSINFIEVRDEGKFEIKDGRNFIISFRLSQMDQISIIFDREWETFGTLQ